MEHKVKEERDVTAELQEFGRKVDRVM